MLAPTRWRFRRPVAAVVAVVVLVLAVTVVVADRWSKENSIPIQGNVASAITTADLTAVARTRVFFGHFNVGMSVLDAIPGVYADHGVSAPPIEQGRAEPGPNGGFIAHKFIGEDVVEGVVGVRVARDQAHLELPARGRADRECPSAVLARDGHLVLVHRGGNPDRVAVRGQPGQRRHEAARAPLDLSVRAEVDRPTVAHQHQRSALCRCASHDGSSLKIFR